VRAANTGISGFIDPAGRILSKTDLFTEDAETMKVPLLTDRTFYTRFGDIFARFGLALALVLVGGKAAASFRRRRRR
jgi:apolipoprotein N-acyltransferase